MDFMTAESLKTVAGATAAVTSITQLIKYFTRNAKRKLDPQQIAFFVSIVVSGVVLSTQEEITLMCIFLAAINAGVVWLASRGAFDAAKDIGEIFTKKDDEDEPQG